MMLIKFTPLYRGIRTLLSWCQRRPGITREEAEVICKLMMQGLKDHEIVHCLKVIQQGSSQRLCHFMLGAAEKLLSPDRWKTVRNALAEGSFIE